MLVSLSQWGHKKPYRSILPIFWHFTPIAPSSRRDFPTPPPSSRQWLREVSPTAIEKPSPKPHNFRFQWCEMPFACIKMRLLANSCDNQIGLAVQARCKRRIASKRDYGGFPSVMKAGPECPTIASVSSCADIHEPNIAFWHIDRSDQICSHA